MNEPQEKCKRKRITYTATDEGIQMAERALKRLGNESKEKFAKSIGMSRSTLTKFFNRVGIQFDSLTRICEELKLDWEEVTGVKSETSAAIPSEPLLSAIGADGKQKKRDTRYKITFKDMANGDIKAILTLEGDVKLDANWWYLQALINPDIGDTIQIEDILEGSIKLLLSGSPEDIEKLRTLINSGELAELGGLPIRTIEIIEDWDKEKSNNKWKLVEDIINNSIANRQLQGIDLSDTDLSGADLSGADLSGADLSEADLSGANLSGTNLSGTNLSGTNLSGANLSEADLRGASLFGAKVKNAIFTNTRGLSDSDRVDLERRGAIFGDRPPVPAGTR